METGEEKPASGRNTPSNIVSQYILKEVDDALLFMTRVTIHPIALRDKSDRR